MKTIDISHPYSISGKAITRAEIVAPSFIDYVAEIEAASAAATAERPFERVLLASRIRRRVTLLDADGGRHAIDEPTLSAMHIRVARPIIAAIEAEEVAGPRGRIIGDGDGVSSPILLALGTPILAASQGEGIPIDELEFQAATYGSLEAVLTAPHPLARAVALVRHVARPADMLVLPSWAADRLAVADGLAIADLIVPRFFG